MVKYFWDSYAVIEFINGNPKFEKYADEQIIFTVFNLVEIYWFSINEYSPEKANSLYNKLKHYVIKIDDETIKQAVSFRKKNKKRKLSYADCIGYIYALNNNLQFLTGDKEFEDLQGVEFTKR